MGGNHGPRRDAAKHRFWEGCIGRWRKSGLSVREFCRRESLSEPLFYSWRRELARREQCEPDPRQLSRPKPRRATFVPIEVVAPRFAPKAGIEIVLPHGRRLRVRPGFDRVTLEAILDVLERRSC